ncbi:AraC family transcriptional regulator [Paraglaciecola arctica]|uniref:AraC family transcriptional regulator n=1 Tax=Paraglaciecola arctica TaxID=1128911 RepID=UPI001C07866C|nr:AraC family transcriptional regulator [Paraglaciecola arctica]MBU3004482.1 AraC family transcriptional regulator [Paraglaciecola arctica]
MQNHLSIRSYSRQRNGHFHSYHQLVLPLRGAINIELASYSGKVAPGECVIIKQGEMHHFTANKEAKFVVADMADLPENILSSQHLVFAITPPLMSYLNFVEKQLENQVNPKLEQSMLTTFVILLEEQSLFKQRDHRIRQVVEYILENLSASLSIESLAKVACLSPTQFKKVFTQQLGLSVSKYIIQERMEKARALLMHTDYPIQIIAEQVGYTDLSAFSRRFSQYYGISPREFSQ